MIEIKGQADMNEEMTCGSECGAFDEVQDLRCESDETIKASLNPDSEEQTEEKCMAREAECENQSEEESTCKASNEEDEAEAESEKESEEDSKKQETGKSEEAEEKPEKKERKLKWAKKEDKKEKEDTEDKEEKKSDPLAQANEKYLRLFAEFDNFRKRTDKEKSERYDMGARDIIEKILPVLDNFERGFQTVEEGDKEDAFVKGMDLVYKQFQKVLEDAGVQPIEALGKEFNPELHNAVMHVDDPEAGENVIVEEFQKGYTYKGHIVRYSMVKVAN